MFRYTVAVLASLSVLFSNTVATAQNNSDNVLPYVYRLKISNCRFEPEPRRQTGFRIMGEAGIVTALHGVVDCTNISATSDDGQEVYNDLDVQAVDFANDTALLGLPDPTLFQEGGLVGSPKSQSEVISSTLRIVGYPLGLEKQDVDNILNIRDIESLDDVIPDAEEPKSFIKRGSPALEINVLNIQISLLPGHSGSPIIDENNQVIAIGNGGLRGGTIDRSWAVLWSDIHLQPINSEIEEQLSQLRTRDPVSDLFFSSTFPAPLMTAPDVPSASERSTPTTFSYQVKVTERSGKEIPGAEVTLTHAQNYEVRFTNSEGMAKFELPLEIESQEGKVQVEASRFSSELRTRRFMRDDPPLEFRLENAAEVIAESSSQISGVHVYLTEFSRFQNTITVRIRFLNRGEQSVYVRPTMYGDVGYLRDDSTNNKYQLTDQGENHGVSIPAGETREFWAKFLLPAEADPAFLSVVLPNGVLFDNVPVPQNTNSISAILPSTSTLSMTVNTNTALHSTVAATQPATGSVEATPVPSATLSPTATPIVIPTSTSVSDFTLSETISITQDLTLAESSTAIADVHAKLIGLTQFQNTVTLRMRLENDSNEMRELWPTNGSMLLNHASGKQYRVTEQGEVLSIDIPAKSTLEVWAKYKLPDGDSPQFVSVELPNDVLFSNIQIFQYKAEGGTSYRTRSTSHIPNIEVQLTEFLRFENTATAKIAFYNNSTEPVDIWPTNRSYLLDEMSGDKFPVLSQAETLRAEIPANSKREFWATFDLSGAVAEIEYMTLILPNGVHFEYLPLQNN